MDGIVQTLRLEPGGRSETLARAPSPFVSGLQHTLRSAISCIGVGLHSGRKVTLTLRPAPADSGIVIRRVDLGVDIPASWDHVVDTRLCTVLGLPGRPEARVGTVEHVLAALAGCGVHNAVLDVDGPEMPILDGSSASFVFLIDCAGIVAQDEAVAAIEVLRPVRVSHEESFVELRPAVSGFDMSVSIAFDATAIGRQALTMRMSTAGFRSGLARARTFTLASEVDHLRQAGLARGGSLDNAVVVDGGTVLNAGGLRMRDEFVRHKVLDVVGDMSLAGAVLRARFVGHRPGHALNNRLLRTLFADPANWRPAPQPEVVAGWQTRLPAAASAA